MPDNTDEIYEMDSTRLGRMDTRAEAAEKRVKTESVDEINQRIEERESEREAEAEEETEVDEQERDEQDERAAADESGGDGDDDGAETSEDTSEEQPQRRPGANGRPAPESDSDRMQEASGNVSRRRRVVSKARSVAGSSKRVARSAGSKAAGAATAVGSGTIQAVDAAAESQQRAASRSDGGGFSDPFEDDGGGDLDVFGSDDATYRDADGDGEPEALFGDFGPDANVTAFDTDRDGNVDVLFGEAEPSGGGRSVDVVIEEATVNIDGGVGGGDPLDGAVTDVLGAEGDDSGVLPDALVAGSGQDPESTLDNMFGDTESMGGDPFEVFDDGY